MYSGVFIHLFSFKIEKLKQNKLILLYATTTTNRMTEVIRIPNIENYTQEIINGELILTPKKQYITEIELYATEINNSTIEEYIIKRGEEVISTNKKNYHPVLVDIWKTMPSERILENTKYKFKPTNERGASGYRWNPDINMSVQYKDAAGALEEIINMVKLNNMSINLSIKLQTGQIVHFKI
jgi:hypothetical protein